MSEFKAVIGLDAFDIDSFFSEFIHNPEEEEVRRIRRLLRISAQDPKAGVLVNSGVLKEPQVRIGYAFTGNERLSHQSEFFLRDGSSAGKVSAYRNLSSSLP